MVWIYIEVYCVCFWSYNNFDLLVFIDFFFKINRFIGLEVMYVILIVMVYRVNVNISMEFCYWKVGFENFRCNIIGIGGLLNIG